MKIKKYREVNEGFFSNIAKKINPLFEDSDDDKIVKDIIDNIDSIRKIEKGSIITSFSFYYKHVKFMVNKFEVFGFNLKYDLTMFDNGEVDIDSHYNKELFKKVEEKFNELEKNLELHKKPIILRNASWFKN